jgi:hypothetical protein
MTFLPQLRDQLASLPPAGQSRRHRAPVIGALLAASVVMTGGALAAAGVIPPGKPLTSPLPTPDPDRGEGAVIASSARVLGLRVPDPAGGPPWGLRIVKTTRGATCLQPGRVVDGKLGVLGQDGVSGNDGKFHELPLTPFAAPGCVPDDGAGHAYISSTMNTVASGPPPTPACKGTRGRDPKLPDCPVGDARQLILGLLGPQVASITYRDGSRTHSQSIDAPEGAYLVVLARTSTRYGFSIGAKPAVGFTIRRIHYRDGTSCGGRVGHDNHPIDCPLAGFTPPQKVPSAAEVERPLTVTGRHKLKVSFRAPVAIQDAGRFYSLWVFIRHGGRECTTGGLGQVTDHDIDKDARVTIIAALPSGCHGSVEGTVALASSAGTGGTPVAPGDPGNLIVGRFTRRLP